MVDALHKAFEYFNTKLYDGKLPAVAITIQSAGRANMLGWHWPEKWRTDDGEYVNEINISAEVLADRTPFQVLVTLIHEMVHLDNAVNDIKDCNAAQYHNRNFKTAAEKVGFRVEKMRGRGFAHTIADEGSELAELIDNYVNETGIEFPISRQPKAAMGVKLYMVGVYEDDKQRVRALKNKYGFQNEKEFVQACIDAFVSSKEEQSIGK